MFEKMKKFFGRFEDLPSNNRISVWLAVSMFTFCGTILLTAFQIGVITENILYAAMTGTITIIALLILYLAVLRFAISETVEKLLRRIHDVRRIATIAEKERLLPIFQNVYERLKEKKIDISPNVKLYIIDTVQINAFAISLTTIAVTRGLMATMTDEEIEALIAHEFGHLYRGDAISGLLIGAATTVYLWAALALKYAVTWLASRKTEDGSVAGILRLPSLALNFAVAAISLIGGVITGTFSRKKEYKADKFAIDLGYAEPLLSALYKFYDMEISDKKKMIDRLQASHPKTAYRIEQIETMFLQEEIIADEEQPYKIVSDTLISMSDV